MGFEIDANLWSAALLQSNPRAIVDAHRAYLDAGAEIIITASYQASRQGLAVSGLSADGADGIIASSVALAEQARAEFLQDNPGRAMPLVAASIGPYGAVLGDGSEYTGDYDLTAQGLREFHASRLTVLDNSNADLLACETIPSITEAEVLCELLQDASKPAWISFSCRDEEKISDGTPLFQAAGLFHEHPKVLAVGINCTAPDLIPPLIDTVKRAVPDKAIIVYPNSGEIWDAEGKSWLGETAGNLYEKSAQTWIDAGANLVGGCCRVGPAEIAAMAKCDAMTRWNDRDEN
jgi:homocysteine S-methyltransferase